MKVKDLIKALQRMSPETEVHFSYTCGDYWATKIAPAVESVSFEPIQHSDYHNTDRIVDKEKLHQNEGDYNAPVRRVVVIS